MEDYLRQSTNCYLTRSTCLVWCVQGWTILLDCVASLEDYLCQCTPCYLTRSTCLVWCVQGWTSCWTGSPHWRITSSSPLYLLLTRSTCLVWCVQGWTSCWTGSPHWRIISASPLLVINEIYMFGLVCVGLDELLDGVASLEDYLRQCTPPVQLKPIHELLSPTRQAHDI